MMFSSVSEVLTHPQLVRLKVRNKHKAVPVALRPSDVMPRMRAAEELVGDDKRKPGES